MGLPAEDDIVTTDKAPQAAATPPESASPEGQPTPESEPHVPMGESIDISIGGEDGEGGEEEGTSEDNPPSFSVKFGERTIRLSNERIDEAYGSIVDSFKRRRDALTKQGQELEKILTELEAAKAAGGEDLDAQIEAHIKHLETLGTMLMASEHVMALLVSPSIPILLLPKEALEGFPGLLNSMIPLCESEDPKLSGAATCGLTILREYLEEHQVCMEAGIFDDQVCEKCRDECCGGVHEAPEVQTDAPAAQAESPEETPPQEPAAEDTAAEGSSDQ